MRQAVPAHVVVAAVDVSVQQPGGSSGAPAVQHCDVHASATQQPTLAECAVGALARMGRIDALVHSPLYVHGAGYADVLLWTSAARARATTPPHAWADAAPHAASPPHATTPHADVSRAEHIMRLHACAGSGGGSGVSTLSSHDTVGAVFAQLRALAGRMRNFRSLDWEYAVWQLAMHIVQPHKVFRMATYRKHYKNSMVRDDPAFLLVIVYILCVCAIASAVTLSSSVWHVLVLVPRFVLVDFLFIAIVTATLGWLLSNRVMRTPEARRTGATVEWWYLFDVYCSAFAPVALFGYGGLLVFLPLLTCGNVLCTVVANLYVLALAVFHVVLQFFGYSETRILQHVGVLVVPTALVAVLLLACTLVNFNVAIWLASWYF